MMFCLQLKAIALWVLLSSNALVLGAKVIRVKAGREYKEHEEVHIVVNKVG